MIGTEPNLPELGSEPQGPAAPAIIPALLQVSREPLEYMIHASASVSGPDAELEALPEMYSVTGMFPAGPTIS